MAGGTARGGEGGAGLVASRRDWGTVMPIRIDRARDVLGVIDVQPTFMPGGELPVAGGDEVVGPDRAGSWPAPSPTPSPRRTGTRRATCPSRPRTGPRPSRRWRCPTASRCCGPTTRSSAPPARPCIPGLHPAASRPIFRKGFRPDIDSYSAFRDNDRRSPTGLGGWLRERGFGRVVPVRPGARLLRRLVGAGRAGAGLRGDRRGGRLPRHRGAERRRGAPRSTRRGPRCATAAFRSPRRATSPPDRTPPDPAPPAPARTRPGPPPPSTRRSRRRRAPW